VFFSEKPLSLILSASMSDISALLLFISACFRVLSALFRDISAFFTSSTQTVLFNKNYAPFYGLFARNLVLFAPIAGIYASKKLTIAPFSQFRH
jgi:hypothetical protein